METLKELLSVNYYLAKKFSTPEKVWGLKKKMDGLVQLFCQQTFDDDVREEGLVCYNKYIKAMDNLLKDLLLKNFYERMGY